MELAPQFPPSPQISIESLGTPSFVEAMFFEVKYIFVKNTKTQEKVAIFFPATFSSHKEALATFTEKYPSDTFEVFGAGILDYNKDNGYPASKDEFDESMVRITRLFSDTLNVETLPEDRSLVLEQAKKYYKSLPE